MSIGIGAKIAGAAATAIGAWMMSGRMDRSTLWETKADSFETNFEYDMMKYEHGNFSGTGMDGMAAKFKRLMYHGPFGIFNAARRWTANGIGFVKDVLLTPATALAVGGLYVAGLKPHNWIAKAGQVVWKSKILQNLGGAVMTGLRALGKRKLVFRMLSAIGKMGVPGIIVAGALALLGFQFARVVNGDEQRSLFRGEMSYNGRSGF